MCGTIRRNLGLEFYKYPIEFNKIMAIPALTYGCENQTVIRPDKRKTETAQIGLLRPVSEHRSEYDKTQTSGNSSLGI